MLSLKCRLILIALIIFTHAARSEDRAQEPAEIIRKFGAAWKAPKGYMRPLDDAGWKARMTAFQQLAKAGDKSIPALTEALANGEPDMQIFAAQALGLMVDTSAKSALETALDSKTPAVRLYALDALSQFGKLAPSPKLEAMKKAERNRDVAAHLDFALNRDDIPNPAQLRKLLADFDLHKMNTAELGRLAPDFTLTDATGKVYQLSKFRGQQPVLLVFVYGDT